MTPHAVARGLVRRGISPIDDKHKAFPYHMQNLFELLQKSHVLTAEIATAAIVPSRR
jgi:hypothetical protein